MGDDKFPRGHRFEPGQQFLPAAFTQAAGRWFDGAGFGPAAHGCLPEEVHGALEPFIKRRQLRVRRDLRPEFRRFGRRQGAQQERGEPDFPFDLGIQGFFEIPIHDTTPFLASSWPIALSA